jgi:hypothetical protein
MPAIMTGAFPKLPRPCRRDLGASAKNRKDFFQNSSRNPIDVG